MSSTQVKLDASASAVNDFYNGMWIYISTLTGGVAATHRQITDYNGSTKVATVAVAWTDQPVTGETFEIYRGNIGYTSFDQATIATSPSSGTPVRAYLDGNDVVCEFILPTGEDAFSLTQIQVQVYDTSGNLKTDQPVAVTDVSPRSIPQRFSRRRRGWLVELEYLCEIAQNGRLHSADV
jgi:hypothetical protein